MSYKLIESTPKPSFKRFVQRSLGLDLIKGLGITLKEFFTPSTIATIKYPLEKIPLSPRYRAIHKLMRLLESGEERCIGCGLCEKICISNCIKIETGYGEDGRKKIDSYTINFGRCIYCGFCAEVCPEIAIIHGERYENSSEQRAHFANKSTMLTPLDLALRGNIDEFAGFGSLREEADECVKLTPTDYVVGNSSLGASCGDLADFGVFADSPVQSHAPNSQKTPQPPPQNTRICDSNKSESQNLSENQAKSAESALDSANSQNLGKNNVKIAESSIDSAHPKQEANSSIVDEFLRSCEASDADRTDGSSRKRGEHEREKSPQDEFAAKKDTLC